jgi:hypothetical protein
MSLASTPILTVVKEAVLGTVGSVRTVPAGTFQYGKHSGLNDDELARRALGLPIFDVELHTAQREPTTTGIFSNFGIYSVALTVSIAYYLSSEVLEDARETARATALDHADLIIQALTFPGNLRQTSAAVSTRLVSACLESDGGAIVVREDPDNNLLVMSLDFIGRVSVTQAAA